MILEKSTPNIYRNETFRNTLIKFTKNDIFLQKPGGFLCKIFVVLPSMKGGDMMGLHDQIKLFTDYELNCMCNSIREFLVKDNKSTNCNLKSLLTLLESEMSNRKIK